VGADQMRLTRRVLINTIAFGALSLLLIVVMAFQVLPTVFGSTYSIYGIFTAAGGVATNQEVTYRGVQVGRVGRMSLTEDAVRIELIIESGHKIPREGTRARVLFKSAVGEQFVDLLPESDGAPFFASGDTIPVDRTSIPIQIEDLLRELDAVLRSVDPRALGTLIHELGTGLTGHGEDIKDLILALDVFAKIGADRRGELVGILGDAADIQDSFNSTREDFVKAQRSARAVLETLVARKDDVQRTVEAARALDTEIIALLDHRRKELNQILADLGQIVRISHAHLGDLDKTLSFLGPFLSDAVAAYDAPYFVFNLLANSEAPSCSYDPSSRPVRAVTDTSPEEPETNFECAGGDPPEAETSLPAGLRVQLDRISWLKLLAPGF
jgi:phospholipid/cholesterol/gamma-HCH transport system substrate-binding protein